MSKPFPHLYNSRRWRRRSALQLKQHPMCEACERQGRTTVATLAHHVVPHNGDVQLFYLGALASLCHDCHLVEHDRKPQRAEIGIDGWPVTVKY